MPIDIAYKLVYRFSKGEHHMTFFSWILGGTAGRFAVADRSMFQRSWRAVGCIGLLVTMTACATHQIPPHTNILSETEPQKLIVFMDGTNNGPKSDTNIWRMYGKTKEVTSENIRTKYVEGVGTKLKVLGLGTGLGIRKDVLEAYEFLIDNYDAQRQDEVYIFGFSRGAYAARILSALLHVAGVPDVSGRTGKSKQRHLKDIYNAYKSKKKTITERRAAVQDVINAAPTSVQVAFLGLWDTVEALGLPDLKQNVELPNPRYADQLCNITEAAHALSLDDDRARIFTPILLTRPHLIRDCENVDIDQVVDEVWFSGAHADIGGGYDDKTLGGVSLNWMYRKIKKFNLVPKGTVAEEDYLGISHDPEAGIAGVIYHKRNRNIAAYACDSIYNDSKLKIHSSALARLKERPLEEFENFWMEKVKYKDCFTRIGDEDRWIMKPNQKCFHVVEPALYPH